MILLALFVTLAGTLALAIRIAVRLTRPLPHPAAGSIRSARMLHGWTPHPNGWVRRRDDGTTEIAPMSRLERSELTTWVRTGPNRNR